MEQTLWSTWARIGTKTLPWFVHMDCNTHLNAGNEGRPCFVPERQLSNHAQGLDAFWLGTVGVCFQAEINLPRDRKRHQRHAKRHSNITMSGTVLWCRDHKQTQAQMYITYHVPTISARRDMD